MPGPLEGVIILTAIRTLVENPSLRGVDRDGGNHCNTARANPSHADLAARAEIAQHPGGKVRRHVNLAAVGQQKSIGFTMLVDQELVHGAGDFGQVVGVDPMHHKAPGRSTVGQSCQGHRKARASV